MPRSKTPKTTTPSGLTPTKPSSTRLALSKRDGIYFTKVEAARKALAARSYELLKLYLANIKGAMRDGDRETAMKSLQWLMLHTPADAEGLHLLAMDLDKAAETKKSDGPRINIGFNLGGVTPQKALPTVEVLSIDPADDKEPL